MSLGIPKNIPAELRKALTEELKLMGATYQDITKSAEPILTPAMVLKMAKAWDSLTPDQKAAWEDRANEENMRRGYGLSRN